MQEVEGPFGRTVSPADITLLFRSSGSEIYHVHGCMQGKLRIGLGDETVRVALAHAQSLHRHGADNADGSLANRLETAVQAVKQAYSQCPSYDALIPALLQYPIEVLRPAFSWLNRESRYRVAHSPRTRILGENGICACDWSCERSADENLYFLNILVWCFCTCGSTAARHSSVSFHADVICFQVCSGACCPNVGCLLPCQSHPACFWVALEQRLDRNMLFEMTFKGWNIVLKLDPS